ncbi:phosphotransferase family protein [Parasphingorhabdus sp.]|uniref:phosphotransferase family protein n=1 Tax=Parasphingorhabdus sp. TaxID=2709688 RepID=UPI003000FC36
MTESEPSSRDEQEAGTFQATPPSRGGDSPEFRERALAWFRFALPGQSVEIETLEMPKANGFSAETFLFGLKVDGALRRYVLRRDPVDNALFVGLDNSHQATVIAALHAARNVPVPAILGEERDPSVLGSPFFVMEHVDGRIPPDNPPYSISGWVSALSAGDRERLWWSAIEAMSGMAAFDWREAGLGHLLRGAPGQNGLEWEFEYYLKLYRDHADGVQETFISEAARWVEKNMPAEDQLTLSWGDARLGNIIFQGTDCAALIDWEQSTIGAVERDLGWWFFNDSYWHEGIGASRNAGWPSHAETEQYYANLVGKPLKDVGFYKAFATFRGAVSMARVTALGMLPDMPIDDFPPARLFKATVSSL